MKGVKYILTVLLLLSLTSPASAQTTDSVDVIDYDISLDFSTGTPYRGTAVLTLQLLRPCASISLDLLGAVDSIRVGNTLVTPTDIYNIPTSGIAQDTPFQLTVYYRVSDNVEASGWGGLHVEDGMTYNLGVGFGTNPHVMGRAFFPCRDNFTDKATYTLRLIAKETWSAECSGVLQERTFDGYFRERSVWRIDHPVCTYLVGISQAPYSRWETSVSGYPVTIGYTAAQDSAMVRSVFALLDSVVPMYERCFGPYRWQRIGYIPTSRGSMEHVQNIALAYQAMESVSEAGQSVIAHELGHAWFGNLVTCSTEGDMWINEGGASFCSEVAREATHGRASATALYQRDLENVVRTTHISDGSYLSLHDMPHSRTYGSTTYDKGALVWHSLRGYLGDSLFYASMRQLFDRCAFGNLDAAALRDSLTLYSGVDLTDFFNFHVFTPGFIDYHVVMDNEGCAPGSVRLAVDQRGMATDSIARGSRVPVALVDWNRQLHRVVVDLDSSSTSVLLTGLSFDPAYCVLDPDCEISDAATVTHFDISSDGLYSSDVVHAELRARNVAEPYDFYVEHHYGKPYGLDTMAGVIRTADRYWVVQGSAWVAEGLEGHFRYVRRGSNSSTYAHLDDNFYRRSASLDSIVLMWRPDAATPWRALTRRHSYSNDEGFFMLSTLRRGEYTLAVVDSNIVGISAPTADPMRVTLFPNPVARGEAFVIDLPVEDPFDVSIYDTAGRRVWYKPACQAGQKLSPGLASGTYLVRIENNFLSLQSNLIQL